MKNTNFDQKFIKKYVFNFFMDYSGFGFCDMILGFRVNSGFWFFDTILGFGVQGLGFGLIQGFGLLTRFWVQGWGFAALF